MRCQCKKNKLACLDNCGCSAGSACQNIYTELDEESEDFD